jgi:hypothetical protein
VPGGGVHKPRAALRGDVVPAHHHLRLAVSQRVAVPEV